MCSNMPYIKELDLSKNLLEGNIPPNIWKCKHLEMLGLAYNNFGGNIPSAIGNVSTLLGVELSYNHLTGILDMSFRTIVYDWVNVNFGYKHMIKIRIWLKTFTFKKLVHNKWRCCQSSQSSPFIYCSLKKLMVNANC